MGWQLGQSEPGDETLNGRGASSPVVARKTMFADVPRRGFADLDLVVPCIAALESNVLLIERAALGKRALDVNHGLVGIEVRRPVDNLAGARSWLVLGSGLLVELDGERAYRGACGDVVGAILGDERGARAMAETALDGLEQTADLNVAGWHLDLDGLVVLFDGAVRPAVGALVEERRHLLGQAVADLAQLIVVAVNLVGITAIDTVPGVGLEVVSSPGFLRVHRTRDGRDGVT